MQTERRSMHVLQSLPSQRLTHRKPPNLTALKRKFFFLPSLCETLPIIQRLPVGASLRVMRGFESRKLPAVNLGSLHWTCETHLGLLPVETNASPVSPSPSLFRPGHARGAVWRYRLPHLLGKDPVPAKCVGGCPTYVRLKRTWSRCAVRDRTPRYLVDRCPADCPKEPFHIEPLDVLQVEVEGTKLDQPIRGLYLIEPGGLLNLGPGYGKVKVGGLSLEEAGAAVSKQLKRTLSNPQVSVTLNESGGQQQIAGEHLIAPDGTINLGTYGQVYVAGLTVQQASEAIEKHLEQYLEAPVVSVDVYAYNSKVYYVVTEGPALATTSSGSRSRVTRPCSMPSARCKA